MIRVTADRRLYCAGHRVHHGLAGLIAVALGLAAMAHDRLDARDWIKDLVARP